MTDGFRLPLVGLATSYCEFSKEDPEAGIRQLRGGKLWGQVPIGIRYWRQYQSDIPPVMGIKYGYR